MSAHTKTFPSGDYFEKSAEGIKAWSRAIIRHHAEPMAWYLDQLGDA